MVDLVIGWTAIQSHGRTGAARNDMILHMHRAGHGTLHAAEEPSA
jgi:ribulose-bisphosphate carboxylase large chain